MSKETGGVAFPIVEPGNGSFSETFNPGMTLRDYFAGQALMGLCAMIDGPAPYKELVTASYVIADAMLKARQP